MAYLCFDIGSSVLKAALVSEEGELLSLARRPVSLVHGPGGAHESEASLWLEAALSAGAEAVSRAREGLGAGARVRAVSVSGNGPTLVPVDGKGRPLGPALSWLDRRALDEAAEVTALAGKSVDATFYLPKALFLWRHAESGWRDRLRWFFSCPEYLVYALSDAAITYLPHPLYEPYIWNAAMIEGLGLPADRFPPFAAPCEKVGLLLPAIARSLGLAPDIPVVAGFPDFLAAIVGSGADVETEVGH